MTAAPRELTPVNVVRTLLLNWRLVLGIPFALAVLVAIVSLLMRPTYTAVASFVPEAGANSKLPPGLAGLAGQFGFALGTDASRSPRFYADVLKSRELLERVLATRYHDPRAPGSSDSARLMDILEIRGRSAADSLSNAVKRLRTLVGTSADIQTNIVRVRVNSRYPELAAAVANQMIRYLNDFNAKSRQSQARERRRFVEQRVADAGRELREAEGSIRGFYERNRTWQQSPQLRYEEGRLRREVDIRQEVYLTLNREFETARIEEVNDTPVITVIDAAVPPQLRTKPRRTLMVLLAGVLGVILGVFVALATPYVQQLRRDVATQA